VSCWNSSEIEYDAMWRIYVPGNHGVAIKLDLDFFAYLAVADELPTSVEELEVISGRVFERRGINNLEEEDFFVRVAHETTAARAADLLTKLARHLALYATDRTDEDLLKQLYETWPIGAADSSRAGFVAAGNRRDQREKEREDEYS
jgi:hypothetical protein